MATFLHVVDFICRSSPVGYVRGQRLICLVSGLVGWDIDGRGGALMGGGGTLMGGGGDIDGRGGTMMEGVGLEWRLPYLLHSIHTDQGHIPAQPENMDSA